MQPVLKHNRKPYPEKAILFLSFIAVLVLTGLWQFRTARETINAEKQKIVYVTDSILLSPPQFSVTGGFYDQPFALKITSDAEGYEIRYTTNGSSPTDTSPLYSAPILVKARSGEDNALAEIPTSQRWRNPFRKVNKGTVIRAAVFTPDGRKSLDAAESYFVFPDKQHYTLPVVSLITDANYLFDHDSGIYVMGETFHDKSYYAKKYPNFGLYWWQVPANYNKRGPETAVPVSIELFNDNGTKVFSSKASAQIRGNASRANGQKSFYLPLRGNHSGNTITLSKDFSITDPVNLLLRNSGNDWYEALMRDPMLQRFTASVSKVDAISFYPVILFINGEYWGIIYISKSQDEFALSEKYGIPADSLSVFRMDAQFNKEKLAADPAFQHLLDFSESHDLKEDSNYLYILRHIDLENYVDYCLIEMMTANTDWPDNNIRMWRYKTSSDGGSHHPRDGRWRMMTFDFDWAFDFNDNKAHEFNMIESVMKDKYRFSILFRRLMKNSSFREYFKSKLEYHLANTFTHENIQAHIEYYYSLLDPEINEHIARWRYPESRNEWEMQVDRLRDFPQKRIPFQRKEMEKFIHSTAF